mgnify:CR=1 FL=1
MFIFKIASWPRFWDNNSKEFVIVYYCFFPNSLCLHECLLHVDCDWHDSFPNSSGWSVSHHLTSNNSWMTFSDVAFSSLFPVDVSETTFSSSTKRSHWDKSHEALLSQDKVSCLRISDNTLLFNCNNHQHRNDYLQLSSSSLLWELPYQRNVIKCLR